MDRLTIDVAGKSVTMHFGMAAKFIWQAKCTEEVNRITDVALKSGVAKKLVNKEYLSKRVDSTKSFAFLVYAGICNFIDIQETGKRPTFEEAYMIAEEICLSDDSLQKQVWDCWENSRANKKNLEELKSLSLSDGEKKSEPES